MMNPILIDLITNVAFSQTAQTSAKAAAPSFFEVLLLPLGFLCIMFLMMRPQAKKAKQHSSFIENLKVGEEVITSGGMIGKIRSVADKFVTVEVANNMSIKIIKQNILSSTEALKPATASKKK